MLTVSLDAIDEQNNRRLMNANSKVLRKIGTLIRSESQDLDSCALSFFDKKAENRDT